MKYILLAASILMMCLIFWFSAQPADDSTEMSNGIGYAVGRLFLPGFEQMTPQEQQLYVESIDHTIRKCAHATEYLILGILCASTMLAWFSGKSSKKRHGCKTTPESRQLYVKQKNSQSPKTVMLLLAGWLIAVLYSVSDEIHQIFVPGRACMFTDILIDSAGITCGVLILAAGYRICKHRLSHSAKQ